MIFNYQYQCIADVGLLTLNQYILLDPILLCFMMCTTWSMARMGALHNEPFTWKWWGWLSFTGVSLACTISVKFVGLFVVLLVGLYTAFELWRELGDLAKPIVSSTSYLIIRLQILYIYRGVINFIQSINRKSLLLFHFCFS